MQNAQCANVTFDAKLMHYRVHRSNSLTRDVLENQLGRRRRKSKLFNGTAKRRKLEPKQKFIGYFRQFENVVSLLF